MGTKYKDMTPAQQAAHRDTCAKWAKANPNAVRAIQKRYKLKNPFKASVHRLRRYGVTPEQFDRALAAQGYQCGVCGAKESGARDWHLDHDHETGEPRGILCVRCNGGLGLFRDDPELLERAARYLRAAATSSIFKENHDD